MSSLAIFVFLINILFFNCEIVNPGSYSGGDFIIAICACALVAVMNYYRRDLNNHTYTLDLRIAEGCIFLFAIGLGLLGAYLLLHPVKHSLFLQKVGESGFIVNLLFISAMVLFTGLNLMGIYWKLKYKVVGASVRKI